MRGFYFLLLAFIVSSSSSLVHAQKSFEFTKALHYRFKDSLKNEYFIDIAHSPAKDVLFVSIYDQIPMIDGVLIFADSCVVLAQNEKGKKVRFSYSFKHMNSPKHSGLITLKSKGAIEHIGEVNPVFPWQGYRLKSDTAMYLQAARGARSLSAATLYQLSLLPGDLGHFFRLFALARHLPSETFPTYIGNGTWYLLAYAYGETYYEIKPYTYSNSKN